jgi:nucleotide-binding universal stress UspA family protein
MRAVQNEGELGRFGDSPGFTSVAVALDLDASGDRALVVARALAELGGVPVERFTQRDLAHLGEPPHGALLVTTSGGLPEGEPPGGDVAGEVLGAVDQPVLLVGPHVPNSFSVHAPTLVTGVEYTDIAAAVPAITRWVRTFGGVETWVTEVIPTDRAAPGPGTNASEHVRQSAQLLAGEGVAASWGLLYGDEPDGRLCEFADQLSDPIFVATSVRTRDGQLSWHHTTRRLVQQSTSPVLVAAAAEH